MEHIQIPEAKDLMVIASTPFFSGKFLKHHNFPWENANYSAVLSSNRKYIEMVTSIISRLTKNLTDNDREVGEQTLNKIFIKQKRTADYSTGN